MDKNEYEKMGFKHHKSFFSEEELQTIEPILIKFHRNWLTENHKYYENGTLNSHSITSSNILNHQEKKTLFNFIAQIKIGEILPLKKPKFLNTQLFFDPKNSAQKNYWHRDIQYTDFTEEAQQETLKTQNIVHVRIPFKDELGVELVPKSHRKWDSKEEYEVRNSLKNRTPSDSLHTGKHIKLTRKDLLVFSANMIHRGIYGNNRFSLDIIYFDDNVDILKFIDIQNLPNQKEFPEFINTTLF